VLAVSAELATVTGSAFGQPQPEAAAGPIGLEVSHAFFSIDEQISGVLRYCHCVIEHTEFESQVAAS
jgi:hypothetical protein